METGLDCHRNNCGLHSRVYMNAKLVKKTKYAKSWALHTLLKNIKVDVTGIMINFVVKFQEKM